MTPANQDVSEPQANLPVHTARARFQKLMAAVLCLLSLGFISAAVMLPGPTAVSENVSNLHEVALAAEGQIQTMESSLQQVRDSATQGNLKQLKEYAEVLKPALENTDIDFEHLKATSNVIGNMADGLRTFGENLEPEHIDSLASGIGTVAGYLEQIEPISEKLADGLDQYAKVLAIQSAAFKKTMSQVALKEAEIDAIEKSLGTAANVLNGVPAIFNSKTIADMRKSLPVFKRALANSKSKIEWILFGDSERQWLNAVENAIQVIDKFSVVLNNLEKQAPQINAAARSFSAVLKKLEGTLHSVKPMLLKLPEVVAQTADKLPALASNLSMILRKTSDFKEVAGFMRIAESKLRESRKLFTATQAQIKSSVVLLEGIKTRLDSAYDNREAIGENYTRMVALTKSTVDGVPLMIANVELTMDTGITNLTVLRTNISTTRKALPEYASVAGFWMVIFRIGLALIGFVFAGQSFWGFKDVGTSH
jgi:ABC-type transporter Mla subunit MlaD